MPATLQHRIVYDEKKQIMIFQPLRQGMFEGILNGSGAKLIEQLSKEGLQHNEKLALYEENKDFLNECYDRGWINNDLSVNGHVSKSVGEHHLKALQIETMLKCNLSCGYCYCSAGNKRKEILSFEQISHLLDDAERLGVLSVDFTGGEFFLHPSWKEILYYARKLGLAISLHTNGTALNKNNVKILDEVGVFRVQITADGADPASHNAIRGSQRAFQQMEAGIRNLQKVGIQPRINIMVHKYTKDHLSSIVDFFLELGTDVNFDWIGPFGSEKEKEIGITAREYFEAVAPLRSKNMLVDPNRSCGRDLGLGDHDYEPDCGIGYSYLFITASGEFAICPILTSRENPEKFDGPNINDHSLFSAWTGHSYFDKHRFVNCKNVSTCKVGTSCKGGCRANAYAQSLGAVDSPNIIECNLRKNKTDQFVNFYERYERGNFDFVL